MHKTSSYKMAILAPLLNTLKTVNRNNIKCVIKLILDIMEDIFNKHRL